MGEAYRCDRCGEFEEGSAPGEVILDADGSMTLSMRVCEACYAEIESAAAGDGEAIAEEGQP